MQKHLPLVCLYLASALLPLAIGVARNFEYEYALFAAWTILVLLPIYGIMAGRSWVKDETLSLSRTRVAEFFWVFFVGPVLVLAVGAAAFATELCRCSSTGYFFWMAVQWYPSWILAHGVYYLIIRARRRGFSSLTVAVGVAMTYAALLLQLGYLLWFFPQKRGFNLLAGFLHGPIYDSWIPVDDGVLWTRLSHFLAACVVLSVAWIKRGFFPKFRIVLSVALWIVAGFKANNYPSTQSGPIALQLELPQTLKGDGFTLHYRPPNHPEKVSTRPESDEHPVPGTDREDAMTVFHEASFHVNELRSVLSEKKLPHVQIYLYPNRTLKKLWFGGGATDVTDVVTPSIHIVAEDWVHRTLRHELVHALTSDFGYKGLGFHPNIAFTEGLAVALAPEERSVSLDQGAASILEAKRISNVANLFSPYFWQESGERAYTVAGSIIRFLIREYGFEGVKSSYGGKTWEEAFGKSRKELLSAWSRKISKDFDRERFALHTEALYRHPGILRSVCPHSRADLRVRREGNLYARLRQPPGWNPGEDYWKWRLSLSPNDVASKLVIWRKEIRSLVSQKDPDLDELVEWRMRLRKKRNDPIKVIEDIELALLEADLATISGDAESNRMILEELVDYSRTKYIGDSLTRQVFARVLVDWIPSGTTSLGLRRYLAGWEKRFPVVFREAEPWIVSYLRLRRRSSEPISREGLRALSSREIEGQLPTTFKLEWYRYLALRFMDKGHFDEALKAWNRAEEVAPAPKKEAIDQARRLTNYYSLAQLAPTSSEKRSQLPSD